MYNVQHVLDHDISKSTSKITGFRYNTVRLHAAATTYLLLRVRVPHTSYYGSYGLLIYVEETLILKLEDHEVGCFSAVLVAVTFSFTHIYRMLNLDFCSW